MRPNYAAWNINPNEFLRLSTTASRLAFLIRFAVLAPSSHNSQPWRFVVRADAVEVFPERTRSLLVSDSNGRHLHVALGCAAENIVLAAEAYGYTPTVAVCPGGIQGPVLRISLSSPQHASVILDAVTLEALIGRRSNRSPYRAHAVSAEVLARAASSAGAAGIADARIHFVTDAVARAALADALMAFRVDAFADAAFRAELARYEIANASSACVGMPGFSMGFGDIASHIAPWIVRRLNVMRLARRKELRLLTQHTPAFGFALAERNDEMGWIAAGRVFERAAITLARDGLATAPSAVPQDASLLQRILAVSAAPHLFFRVGMPTLPAPLSPRLPADAVTEYDKP